MPRAEQRTKEQRSSHAGFWPFLLSRLSSRLSFPFWSCEDRKTRASCLSFLRMCLDGAYGSAPPLTTGNRDFAECKILCRVSKIRHSAKNCTRQRFLCRVPGIRQKNALGKELLRRVLDSRQKSGTRHRLTRVTVFGHVLLCRVPAVRHSAKI